jgi:hypothetical protein
VWEALLFLQAPLVADHPVAEPLQELVMSRLEACHAAMADRWAHALDIDSAHQFLQLRVIRGFLCIHSYAVKDDGWCSLQCSCHAVLLKYVLLLLLLLLLLLRACCAHIAWYGRNAAHKRLVAVEGKADDWFVYKVPKNSRGSGAGAGTGVGLGLMQDTVNVGRHTITEVRIDAWHCCWVAVRHSASLTQRAVQNHGQQQAVVLLLIALLHLCGLCCKFPCLQYGVQHVCCSVWLAADEMS